MRKFVTISAVAVISLLTTRPGLIAQGTFVNLDFENPILPLTPVNFLVPIVNAMPGWQGYIGGGQVENVVYNTVSLGSPAISFHGPGSLRPILQGSYGVIMQSSFPGGLVVPSIGQTGMIPTDAKSIRFYADQQFMITLAVAFNGSQFPLFLMGADSNYNILGGDISAFAGQTGELRFFGDGYLDNVFFSPEAVPEPSVFGLFALGSLLLGWRFLKRRV